MNVALNAAEFNTSNISEISNIKSSVAELSREDSDVPTPVKLVPESDDGLEDASNSAPFVPTPESEIDSPYFSRISGTAKDNSPGFRQKLDYMIHLLESQRDIRTGSATEDLVLYGFLGVFIIFVLDSFNKSAKYKR